LLLQPVMQIACNAAPGIIGRCDDPGPHGGELGPAASRRGRFEVPVRIRRATAGRRRPNGVLVFQAGAGPVGRGDLEPIDRRLSLEINMACLS
jgi:hypothetical protein